MPKGTADHESDLSTPRPDRCWGRAILGLSGAAATNIRPFRSLGFGVWACHRAVNEVLFRREVASYHGRLERTAGAAEGMQ